MPTLPRLEGLSLRTVARAADSRTLRGLVRRLVAESFGLDRVLDLPVDARGELDESPRPVQAQPPRDWEHAGLEAPAPAGHREHAEGLRKAYVDGRLSPVDVCESIAEAVDDEDFGDCIHSPFVWLDFDRSRRAARESAERWEAREPIGPLDGIPVPVKDQVDVEGLPTGSGTSFMESEEGPAGEDSEIVRRLRRAGALVVAKSRTTEWGMQPTGFNATQPMPRNPYDRNRAAGGSSTGTAAAVGLGLAPVGLGSDGGGSIRIPAALSGVFGLKPTFQRLSRVGDAWKNTMSHCGPLGSSTADLVDFLAVTGADPDPRDPATDPRSAGVTGEALVESWRRALGRGVEGCRIGLWSWAFETVGTSIAEPCRTALRALEREGAELVDLEIPYSEYHETVGPVVLGTESRAMLEEVLEAYVDETGEDVRLMMSAIGTLAASDYMMCRRVRSRLRESVASRLETVDLIAAPTTGAVAPEFPLEDDRQAIYDEEAIQSLCRYAFLANLTGLPAGTAPVGLADGLPVGLQLIGDAWDEASIFAAMAHLERIGATDLPEPGSYHGWS